MCVSQVDATSLEPTLEMLLSQVFELPANFQSSGFLKFECLLESRGMRTTEFVSKVMERILVSLHMLNAFTTFKQSISSLVASFSRISVISRALETS